MQYFRMPVEYVRRVGGLVGRDHCLQNMWYGNGLSLVEAAEQSSLLKRLDDLTLDTGGKRKGIPQHLEGGKPAAVAPAEDEELEEFLEMQRRQRKEQEAREGAAGEDGASETEDIPDPKRARSANSELPVPGPEGEIKPAVDELPGVAEASKPAKPPTRPPPLTEEQQGDEEARYQERVAEDKQMDEMSKVLQERRKILRTARQNFDVEKYRFGDRDLYQEAFNEEDVYYQLLTQGMYATNISVTARAEGTNNSQSLVPALRRVVLDGTTMIVPAYSKRDYELTMTANYARSKRLLNPTEPDPPDPTQAKDMQTLHSELRFGFSVFSAEKKMKPGGTKHIFKFGEGTCDVDDATRANPDELRRERRSNLYRYQTLEPPTATVAADPATLPVKDAMHTLEVGSLELFKQPRAIGYPMFVSPFVKKGSLSELVYDQKGFVNLSDAENAKKYHRAMRYRFEVMRLWWKLFHNQQDLVRELIEVESMGGENSPISQSLAYFTEALRDTIDASRPPMILSIIELGREGSLRYGDIYPKYVPSDDFDATKNRNLFKRAAPSADAVLAGVLEDENERLQTQPVQLWENYCWPVVMPGMTQSWLDWVAGATKVETKVMTNTGLKTQTKIINGVKDRNLQAFQIMRAFFNENLAADYDTVVANPPDELEKYKNELLGNAFSDRKERERNFWLIVEVVSGDLMQAMPYWANAYLCEDLVSHPPEDVEVKSRQVKQLEEEVGKLSMEIEALKKTIDADPKTDIQKLAKAEEERELYYLTVSRAEKINSINELTYHSSASSILWMPYASKLRKSRDKDDDQALFSKTWAQESLHRCILSIYDSSWVHEYYSTNMGPEKQPQRNYNGNQIIEGQSDAAELYRQWFSEVYLELGDNGIALPNQLVIMTNLVKEGKPVLTDPKMQGSVQLQGHVARIVKRVPRHAKEKPEAFPPFDYILETQFDFVGTCEEREAARRAGKITPNNKWLVTLSGLHIMPFSYNHQYRYGDTVEVIELTSDVAPGLKPEQLAHNNKIFRGTNPNEPLRWSVVEAPYVGPPSVLETYGIGTFNPSVAKESYADAKSKSPEWAQHTVEIGALLLSPYDHELFEEQRRSEKDEYLRWPVKLVEDAEGIFRSVLLPLDSPVDTVPSMSKLSPYRMSSKGQEVRRFLRPDKVRLIVQTSASSEIETDENSGPHACIDKECEERA